MRFFFIADQDVSQLNRCHNISDNWYSVPATALTKCLFIFVLFEQINNQIEQQVRDCFKTADH